MAHPRAALDEGPGVVLPWLSSGRRGIAPPSPATREAEGRTATAAGQATQTAAAEATLAPSATRTLDPTPTATMSPEATLEPTVPTGITPTATATEAARDPAEDRLQPRGALRPGRPDVRIDADRRLVRLATTDGSGIAYEIDLTHPDVTRGRLTVREVQSGRYPVTAAGLYYRRLDGVLVEPWLVGRLGGVDSVEHEMIPDGVRITVRETLEGAAHRKQFDVRLVGRSLEVRLRSLDGPAPARGTYAGASMGDLAGTSDGQSVRLPYMDAAPVTMLDHAWFAGTLLEYTRSGATQLLPRGPEALPNGFVNEVAALYTADTSGRVSNVDETVWLTLSAEVSDLFPEPSQSPSPVRDALADVVHVTIVGPAASSRFDDQARYLAGLATFGVDRLAVHKLGWSDPSVLEPGVGPPDPGAGGTGAWSDLLGAASLVAPSMAYSTTVTGCPGAQNPLFREADTVVDGDGVPKGLVDEAGGRVGCPDGGESQRYLLPADAAYRLAITDGMAAASGADAVHVPDLAAWNPGYAWPGAAANVLDRSAPARHAATVADAVAATKRLFAALQTTVGPVFGDGAYGLHPVAFDSFYAGYVDGLARSLTTGSPEGGAAGALMVPDYEIGVARHRLVGYGMGAYERFFGVEARTPGRLDDEQLDHLRASTLAFGHAGAWWTVGDPSRADWLSLAEQVKEYHLMRPLQARYLSSATASIAYESAGQDANLDEALTTEQDLFGPRLHLTYDALELWVNLGDEPWTVERGGESYALPRHGWLAVGDDLQAYSATIGGRRVDVLSAPDVALIDGRGTDLQAAGLSGRDLVVRLPDGRRVVESPDGSLSVAP
jgi:hypothetical protein